MRILLVEDHPLMVAGLRSAISADHDIVHVIGDGNEVLPWLERNSVDLITLDLTLPNRFGHELLPEIQALSPAPRVLIVTMHDDADIQNGMQAKGAHGFIAKDASDKLFRLALAEVAAGRTWFPDRREEYESQQRKSWSTREPRLTRRDADVLNSLGDDLSRKATADRLGMSIYTVDDHLAALRRAFRVATNNGVVRAAVAAGRLPLLWISRRGPRPRPD
jgi:DNA-binding NarL/FixJ family response regulator